MKPITVLLPYSPGPLFETTLSALSASSGVDRVVIVGAHDDATARGAGCVSMAGSITEEHVLGGILERVATPYILLVQTDGGFSIESSALEALVGAVLTEDVGGAYADFIEIGNAGGRLHPVNDYQAGSVRDNFDFGPAMLFSTAALRHSRTKHGRVTGLRYAGLYDLRLKLSIDYRLRHVSKPLSSVKSPAGPVAGQGLFNYVDPRNTAAQREMEIAFTDYLKRIGAYVPPSELKDCSGKDSVSYPVGASVIIPVKNRSSTIGEAVRSALGQTTDFPFNVIVVDNHSTDDTTKVVAGLAAKHSALNHVVPRRTDFAIGGCWNAAIDAPFCGRYAVQLDSDDLYQDSRTLQRIVDVFRQGKFAMVIGAYTLVDSDLREIPPGLIDHREWTDDNGHNNALRVNGLGAPRAFETAIIRSFRFLNVSYGEDYAAALRVCRQYRIGRVFESLYLCRRWSGNTDASLTVEETNRNDAFKDKVRTDEIRARQKMNESGRG